MSCLLPWTGFAAAVLAAITEYRCTVFFGVPTMFQMMLEATSRESKRSSRTAIAILREVDTARRDSLLAL